MTPTLADITPPVAGATTTSGDTRTLHRGAARRRHPADSLRGRLEHDFSAAYGRAPQAKQLDWLERVTRSLGRSYHHEGGEFVRSVPQLARSLGLPHGNVRDARSRYRNQLANTLRYLEAMGWVEQRETLLRESGAGRGWALRLTARGCSSVGYSVTRPRGADACRGRHGRSSAAHPGARARLDRRAGSSLSAGFAPPSGENSGRDPLRGPLPPFSRDGSGRTRARGGYAGPFAVAALEARCRREGVDGLEAAWRDGAPLWAVLRGAALALGLPAKLSRHAELQAVRSVAQMDRLAGRRGEGVGQLLGVLEDAASGVSWQTRGRPIDRPGQERPAGSLGYYVTELRRRARQWRKARGASR